MDNNNELMTNITAMVQNYIDDQLSIYNYFILLSLSL